jgi:hypothetical protein
VTTAEEHMIDEGISWLPDTVPMRYLVLACMELQTDTVTLRALYRAAEIMGAETKARAATPLTARQLEDMAREQDRLARAAPNGDIAFHTTRAAQLRALAATLVAPPNDS